MPATEKYYLQQTEYGKWILSFDSDTNPEYWVMDKEHAEKLVRKIRELAALFSEKGF